MIRYEVNAPVAVEQFIDVLRRSTLGERRPIDDRECMEGMVNNSNLLVTAWDGEQLVGVARSMTDFHYACYLSDLAVDQDYQRQGIGKQLQILTQQQLGRHCKLILIAAPAANAYYGRIGLGIRTIHVAGCWIEGRGRLDSCYGSSCVMGIVGSSVIFLRVPVSVLCSNSFMCTLVG